MSPTQPENPVSHMSRLLRFLLASAAFLGLLLGGGLIFAACNFPPDIPAGIPSGPYYHTPTHTPTPSPTPTNTPTPELVKLDFGDAPDPTYPSLAINNGARVGVRDFWLGVPATPPTTEQDAKITDLDEFDDGLLKVYISDGRISLTFQAAMSTSASMGSEVYFNLLVDTNGDGRWQGSQEWIEINRPVSLTPGQTVTIETDFAFPSGIPLTWLRAMLTDTMVNVAAFPNGWDGTGEYKYGEVEDYWIHLPYITIKEPVKVGDTLLVEGYNFPAGTARKSVMDPDNLVTYDFTISIPGTSRFSASFYIPGLPGRWTISVYITNLLNYQVVLHFQVSP